MLSGKRSASEVMLYIFADTNELTCRGATKNGRSWDFSEWEERIPLSTSEALSHPKRLDDGLRELSGRLAGHQLAESQTRVIVADTWISVLGVPWSQDLCTPKGSITYLLEQATAAGYRVEREDFIRLGDGSYAMPRVLCIFPRWLVASFDDFSSTLNSRLVSIVPLSAIAWHSSSEKKGFRAVMAETDGMVLSVWGQLDPVGVSVRRKPFSDGGLCAAEFWNSLCLKQPVLEQEEHPALIDLTQISRTATQANGKASSTVFELCCNEKLWPSPLDAIASPSSQRATSSSAITLGFALIAAVSLFILGGGVTNQSVELSSGPSSAKVSRDLAAAPSDRLRLAAINVAIRELNLPVRDLLSALAPQPGSGVSVLEFATVAGRPELNGQQPTVRVIAEARNATSMTDYVSRVSATPPYVSAHIVQHETQSMNAEKPLRFTAVLEWSTGQ